VNPPAGRGDDLELVRRFCAAGDEAAFRALHARHSPALYAFLRRLVGPDAEDALQETWLRAARRMAGFRGDAALRTWLFAIALNSAREVWRDRGTPDGVLVDLPAPAGEPALDLEQAVAALPPGYRAVLLLHDSWGYTHAEVAAFLGILEGTSKSQLAHARAAVRRRLAGHAPALSGGRA
jgi:RNA polymerase sigma-70 factor (ECF subfamily)